MNPIYLAIDIADGLIARQIIDEVGEFIGGVKIGLTFFYANGPAVLLDTVAGFDWFLDVKIHDIPVQSAGAIRSLMPLKPNYISVHIGEMKDSATEAERWTEELMLRSVVAAATDEATKLGVPRPKLLGVTKLTNLPATQTEIVMRAHRGLSCGLDGIIGSPLELPILRSELGTKPILVTPGIRVGLPVADDDQMRTASPRRAIDDGANIIVVGRPIMRATDRREAAKSIVDSLR